MISEAAPHDIFPNLPGPWKSRLRAFITRAPATAEDRADFFQEAVLIPGAEIRPMRCRPPLPAVMCRVRPQYSVMGAASTNRPRRGHP